MKPFHSFTAIALGLAVSGALAAVVPQNSVAPVAAGTYAVGCSNVAQNFALAPDDATRDAYWSGNTPTQYLTQILAEPQGAFSYSLQVPNDSGLFPDYAGQTFPYVAIVCYPTPSSNARPDYPFNSAGTLAIPRMQRGSEPPLFDTSVTARYPVLLYAHGLNGSPLSDDYLHQIVLLASYGYVVLAPFQGDGRFADLTIEDFADLLTLLIRGGYWKAVELQAIRPLAMKVALDTLLADPNYRDHVDASRIAGFGISLGGETLVALGGAQLTTHAAPHIASQQIVYEPRMKAIVGFIPYFGQTWLPAFGDSQTGIDNMPLPFLGMSGTADPIAPIVMTEEGANHMHGPHYVVAFAGLNHAMPVSDYPDIFTWTLTFLDAHLNGNAAAHDQLMQMKEVAGGGADSVALASDASNYNVALAPGWNLLGTGCNASLDVAASLGDPVTVTSVWSWNNSGNTWNFYSPLLTATGLADYANSRGFAVLSAIQGGTGFWVNATQSFSLSLPSGALCSPVNNAPRPGWNLVAVADNSMPARYGASAGSGVASIWAWDNTLSRWYFYAPALEQSGELSAFQSNKGYLDFRLTGKALGQGLGFWVSKP